VGSPQPRASSSRRRSIFVAFALLCGFAVVPAISVGAHTRAKEDSPPPVPQDKVVICHRDANPKQPYGPKAQEVSVDSIVKDNNGHATHTGPVWKPPPDTPDEWGDIIPPFWYSEKQTGEIKYYGGLNKDEGAKIYQDDCQVPPPPPPTQIAVVKILPSGKGKFDLKVGDVTVAPGVGDKGNGVRTVAPDTEYTVREVGADGTDLEDYEIDSRCTAEGGPDVGTSHGDVVDGVTVAQGATVTCTFTNTLPPKTDSVTPELECVLFKDGQPDVAYWGYNNTNDYDVPIQIGSQNTFVPAPADQGQPELFTKGRHVGVFTTEFEGSLVWSLTGTDAPASANSPPCDATIEVRKVTVPATDQGKFNLLINDTVVKTGGHGTTTGHREAGPGEASVSETAGPGTSLADYTSKVECTRNGTLVVSEPSTKVDGPIAQGDTVVCTFTNTRKGTPPEPPQPLPPTPPDPDPPPVPTPTPPGPAPQLDLVVTKSVEPDTVAVGGRLTWTMIVTNQSSVAAADVNALKVNDRSFRTRLISLNASQGTCRPSTCNLGRLAPGASARITAVTEATQVGVVVNIVRVSSEEQESNYRNNVAAAIAQVVGRLAPPVVRNRCDTLTVAPRVLQNRRSSVVVLTALNGRGRPVAGIRVRVRGPGVDTTVTTDRRGTVRRTVLPRRAGLFFFTGVPRTRTGGGMHCRTLLGVLGASDTRVTG